MNTLFRYLCGFESNYSSATQIMERRIVLWYWIMHSKECGRRSYWSDLRDYIRILSLRDWGMPGNIWHRIIGVPDEIRLEHIPNKNQKFCRLSPLAGAQPASHHATLGFTEQLRIPESPTRYPRYSLTVFIASFLSYIFAQRLRIIPSQLKLIRIIYTF